MKFQVLVLITGIALLASPQGQAQSIEQILGFPQANAPQTNQELSQPTHRPQPGPQVPSVYNTPQNQQTCTTQWVNVGTQGQYQTVCQ